MPDTEVRESKDRVRAALQNAGFKIPSRRITVNLAPADLPKESGRFDLPIALGILAASGQIPNIELERYEFAGELSLSGELRAFILPLANADEAALVSGAHIYSAATLLQVCGHFTASNADGRLPQAFEGRMVACHRVAEI